MGKGKDSLSSSSRQSSRSMVGWIEITMNGLLVRFLVRGKHIPDENFYKVSGTATNHCPRIDLYTKSRQLSVLRPRTLTKVLNMDMPPLWEKLTVRARHHRNFELERLEGLS